MPINITGRRKWTLTPWFKNNVRNRPDWANYFLKVRWLQVFLKVAFLVDTSFGSLTCVLDKPFFSFLGTSSIKIFLLFLWNGHFNCLHFTSYMVCSMDIYWSGKDYFGTHLFVVYAKLWLWSMQIIFSWLKCFFYIYDSDLMSLIWSLHWRFSHHTTL